MSQAAKIQAVSLILVLDDQEHVDARLWQVARALGRADVRAQILLVHRQGASVDLGRLTYRPWPRCFATIAEAAAEAQYAQLAIVEAGAEVTTSLWQRLMEMDAEAVRWSAVLDRPASTRRRGLLSLDRWVSRLLLRTRKSKLVPGVCLFRYNQIRHVLDQLCGNPAEDLLRLIALARLQGQAVEESMVYRSGPGHVAPSTKQAWRSLKATVRFWFNVVMFPRHQSELIGRKPKRGGQVGWTLVLMLLAGWMFFGNLNYPLLEPDESRNAQLAINLLDSGQWSALTLDGRAYLDKPPLQAWLTAISYQCFGQSPWAARLPVAVVAWLTVLMTFFVGRRWVGFWAAWWAGMMLVLNGGYVLAARFTTMDVTLSFCITATLLYGWLSVRSGFSRRSAALAGAAAGLGLLAKGPIVIAICLPPLWLARWMTPMNRQNPRLRTTGYRWAWFVFPALLIAGPWYLQMLWTEPEFVPYFLWHHHVVRFTGGVNHQGPFWYYLVGLFVFLFPLSYLIPSLLKFLSSRGQAMRQRRSREMGWLVLAIVWILLFFSASGAKLPTYVLPAFPLISLLMGAWLEQAVWRSEANPKTLLAGLIRRGRWELPAWCLALGAVAIVFWDAPAGPVVAGIVLTAIVGGLAMWSTVSWPARRVRRITWVSFAVSAAVMVALAGHYVLPSVAQKRSDRVAVEQWQQAHDPDVPVLVWGRDSHVAGPAAVVFSAKQGELALAEVGRHGRVLLVASGEHAARVRDGLGDQSKVEKLSAGRHVYLVTTSASRTASQLRLGPPRR